MRRQMKIKATILLCGIGIVMAAGCNSNSGTVPPPDTSAASVQAQIDKVQARTDLDDQQKQSIVAMLKAHSTPAPHTP